MRPINPAADQTSVVLPVGIDVASLLRSLPLPPETIALNMAFLADRPGALVAVQKKVVIGEPLLG
jgi:hypothetical protein